MRIGAYVVDPDAGTVTPAGGGRPRHISPQARATLLYLVQHRGAIAAREAILHQWPAGFERTDEALRQAIHVLREAFADDARHSRYIKTAKNIGYALIAPVDTDSSSETTPSHDGGVDHSRFLYRVAVLYWGAAWVVLQLITLVFDLDSREKLTVIGVIIVSFLVALITAWWLQRKLYLPRVLEWLLRLIPQSAAALIVATAVVGALLLLVVRSIGTEAARKPAVDMKAPIAAADKYSVAVLPFLFEGGESSYSYLADGLPEELIAVLSRLNELQVVSRTSSFYYKGRDVDLATIARQLQVAHIVEGRVAMEQEQLRVTITLVNAPSGRAVWSHTYRQRLGSVFELYDGVMARVAQELAIEISPDLHASLAPMRSGNEEAYSLYLQGRDKLRQPKERGVLEQARDLFVAATAQDPTFARAFAGLCDTYLAQYRANRDNALIAPATEACHRALELDPAASEVQIALAKLHIETGDYEDADREIAAALQQSPRSYNAFMRLGELRWDQQRPDEAEAAYKSAISLQPGSWQAYSAYGAFLVSVKADYKNAEAQFQRVLSLTPDSAIALSNLGAAYMFEGRLEEAAASYESLRKLDPNGQTLSNLGLIYYYLGRYADAVQVLDRASALAPNDHRVWGNLALAQSYNAPDLARSRETYLKAIELGAQRLAVDPNDTEALADVATYDAAVGHAENALKHIEQATTLSPDDGSTLYLAGIVHELLGSRDQAVVALLAALRAGYPRAFIENDARLRDAVRSDAYQAYVASSAR